MIKIYSSRIIKHILIDAGGKDTILGKIQKETLAGRMTIDEGERMLNTSSRSLLTPMKKASGTRGELLSNLLEVAKQANFHDDLEAAEYINEHLEKFGYRPEFKIFAEQRYVDGAFITVRMTQKQEVKAIIESHKLYPIHTDAFIMKFVDIYDSLEY